MKKLNVIDLDQTLVTHNTLLNYIVFFITHDHAYFFKILPLVIKRFAFHLVNEQEFYKSVVLEARKYPHYKEIMESFRDKALHNLNGIVLNKIKEYTDVDTVNVICSASPVDYVSLIAEKLGFDAVGSYFDESQDFIYLHGGEMKLREIMKRYPKNEYIYNFSISDSRKDVKLLEAFNQHILFKGQNEF